MPRVVLFQPQIPPNTGNVARTCAATGSELHLIEPLGFEISDSRLRRAGLDYWPFVSLRCHADLNAFLAGRSEAGGRLVALSSHARTPYTAFAFAPSDWLLFGRESDGLPPSLLEQADARLTIPMAGGRGGGTGSGGGGGGGGVRSLNLSVAVAVVLFEALRQQACLEPPPT
jgi:tRNA (cytidine/uridine-2'-O-)-methyltransferase